MSSSNSPCAACKFLRRKCTQECVFAPYFPPDNPQRFAYVHKVFGASNVAKLLNDLNAAQRDDAVKSLAYEAEARLRDPVYGCVGLISVLQHKIRQIQMELTNAKKELAVYAGPQALHGVVPPPAAILQPHHHHHHHNAFASQMFPYNGSMAAPPPHVAAVAHGGQLLSQQPQILDDRQQLAAAVAVRDEADMFRGYDQHQHQQQEFLKFNGGFDVGSVSSGGGGGFSQVTTVGGSSVVDELSPSLALGSFDNNLYNHMHQQQQEQQGGEGHHHLQAQLLLSPRQQKQATHLTGLHQQPSESEDCRSVGPSR